MALVWFEFLGSGCTAGMLNQSNYIFPGVIVVILCCPGGTSQLIVIM